MLEATSETAGRWARRGLTAIAALGAVSALVAAVWAGLGRMGAVPPPPGWLVAAHGPLIVNGFFGAVISLERAVAVDRLPAYAIPALAAAGTWLAVGGGAPSARWLAAAAALGAVVLFATVTYRAPELHHAVMGAGAVAWAAGATIWAVEGGGSWTAPLRAPWWAAFLIATIAGERLELARVLRPGPWQRRALVSSVGLLLVGAGWATFEPGMGVPVFALGVVGIAVWLGLFDVARRTARREGLTAYIGRVLLVGYAWLGVGGGLLVAAGGATAGPLFGAAWHAVLLGFVFSMIFAHAPVVLRALAGLRVSFHPVLYTGPVVLSLTLVLRVVGDLGGWFALRSAGGIGNAAAIGLFALSVAVRLE
ncbi:MAG: hypothetical protein ABEL76_04655 [Bradymonadaceae bacterium]